MAKVSCIGRKPRQRIGLVSVFGNLLQVGHSLQDIRGSPDTTDKKTNSGLRLQTDDIIASLKGHEHEYDALVFACGDAMPKFAENADKPYNVDMLSVIKNFADQGKTIAGHCAAALLFDNLGSSHGADGWPASVPQTGRQKLYRNGRKSRHRRQLLHGTEREYDFLPAARTVESVPAVKSIYPRSSARKHRTQVPAWF